MRGCLFYTLPRVKNIIDPLPFPPFAFETRQFTLVVDAEFDRLIRNDNGSGDGVDQSLLKKKLITLQRLKQCVQ